METINNSIIFRVHKITFVITPLHPLTACNVCLNVITNNMELA